MITRQWPKAAEIQHLRESHGWSQAELARRSGYSIKTIWKAETGRRLKRQTLADIAAALGTQIEAILLAAETSAVGLVSARRKVVLEVLAEMQRGTYECLIEHLHEDAIFVILGHSQTVPGRILRGRGEIATWIEANAHRLPIAEIAAQCVVEEDEYIDVHMAIAGNAEWDVPWLHACALCRFWNDQVASVQVYWNTCQFAVRDPRSETLIRRRSLVAR